MRSSGYTPRLGSSSWSEIFWRKPSVDERGPEARYGRSQPSEALDRTAVRAGLGQSLLVLLPADWRKCREPGADAVAPWYGSRQMARHLRRQGHMVGRKRVRRLMGKMGLAAVYQHPRTTVPHPEHRVYPYLLRGLTITRPDHVWCADITYIPMRRGFLYLVAIMDWASRKVLAWRLSNTVDADFCIEALQEAMVRYGRPEIFNTDQGSQFTSPRFTELLTEAA